MIDWKDTKVTATYSNAQLLDCALRAYPARKRGLLSIHFHATFGIPSNVSFSITHYTRYLEGRLSLPSAGLSAEFDEMSLWNAKEFCVNGDLVAGQMHLIAHVPWRRIRPQLAQVDIRLGIKFAHPPEDETRITANVPLHLHRATGACASNLSE